MDWTSAILISVGIGVLILGAVMFFDDDDNDDDDPFYDSLSDIGEDRK